MDARLNGIGTVCQVHDVSPTSAVWYASSCYSILVATLAPRGCETDCEEARGGYKAGKTPVPKAW